MGNILTHATTVQYPRVVIALHKQEPIKSNDKGACNCVLRNVDGEIQTWHPILFLVSLHIAMYGQNVTSHVDFNPEQTRENFILAACATTTAGSGRLNFYPQARTKKACSYVSAIWYCATNAGFSL